MIFLIIDFSITRHYDSVIKLSIPMLIGLRVSPSTLILFLFCEISEVLWSSFIHLDVNCDTGYQIDGGTQIEGDTLNSQEGWLSVLSRWLVVICIAIFKLAIIAAWNRQNKITATLAIKTHFEQKFSSLINRVYLLSTRQNWIKIDFFDDQESWQAFRFDNHKICI